MPQYYQFGYQPYNYQSMADGFGHPGVRAGTLRELGDVTNRSEQFFVPRTKSPYALHKARSQRPAHFRVPRSEDPYYTHKDGTPPTGRGQSRGRGPRAQGDFGLAEGDLIKYATIGAVGYLVARQFGLFSDKSKRRS